MMGYKYKLGYLSGAPRVSTRPEAAASGPRTHVLGVIGAFQRLGWEVYPYIVGDKVPISWIKEESEQTLQKSALFRLGADLVRLVMGLVHGWRASRELPAVDWVYERYGVFQALGWWFQRKGIPWILETNELCYVSATSDHRSTRNFKEILKIHERWAYRQCDILVCTSQDLADLIVRNLNIPIEKIIVVPNGVDVDRLDPDKVQPKRFFEGPTIGFVGQLAPWQRLDILLEAMAELRKEGIVYNLVVVGNGPMRDDWEVRMNSLDLAQQVRFVGQVPWDEVPGYIAGFDLGYAGAVPLAVGKMYHSPLKLYEYASMAKPIVAAAYDDALQLTKNGAQLYLFEPGNREDLIRALHRAYQEREAWPAYGARNRAIVSAKHTWEQRISEMIAKAERILERKYGTPYPARR